MWLPERASPGDVVTLRAEVRDRSTGSPIPSGLVAWFLGRPLEVRNPSVGVFEADIHIPENLPGGIYSVDMVASAPKGWYWSGSVSMEVAPPPGPEPRRLPTVLWMFLSLLVSALILIPFIPP